VSADPSKMRVTVNGIDAPVLSMASNRLDVQAPWEISGAKALVRVTGPDGGYADTLVEIQSVVPALGGGLGILRPSGDFDMNPAAFAAGNVVVFLAEGLGGLNRLRKLEWRRSEPAWSLRKSRQVSPDFRQRFTLRCWLPIGPVNTTWC